MRIKDKARSKPGAEFRNLFSGRNSDDDREFLIKSIGDTSESGRKQNRLSKDEKNLFEYLFVNYADLPFYPVGESKIEDMINLKDNEIDKYLQDVALVNVERDELRNILMNAFKFKRLNEPGTNNLFGYRTNKHFFEIINNKTGYKVNDTSMTGYTFRHTLYFDWVEDILMFNEFLAKGKDDESYIEYIKSNEDELNQLLSTYTIRDYGDDNWEAYLKSIFTMYMSNAYSINRVNFKITNYVSNYFSDFTLANAFRECSKAYIIDAMSGEKFMPSNSAKIRNNNKFFNSSSKPSIKEINYEYDDLMNDMHRLVLSKLLETDIKITQKIINNNSYIIERARGISEAEKKLFSIVDFIHNNAEKFNYREILGFFAIIVTPKLMINKTVKSQASKEDIIIFLNDMISNANHDRFIDLVKFIGENAYENNVNTDFDDYYANTNKKPKILIKDLIDLSKNDINLFPAEIAFEIFRV